MACLTRILTRKVEVAGANGRDFVFRSVVFRSVVLHIHKEAWAEITVIVVVFWLLFSFFGWKSRQAGSNVNTVMFPVLKP